MTDRLSEDELRKLFLFESLDAEKLSWLAGEGLVERVAGGRDIYVEGDPATSFYVLISGTVSLNRLVHGDDLEVSRTSQPGVYAGAMQAYLGDRVPQVYSNTLRAITDVELFVLPAGAFALAMREWFPMAMHLLEGLFFGMRNSQTIIGERQRLIALGSLSAGLTHELNNPAAAAVRATSILRDRITGMRHKLALIADGRLDGTRLQALVELQEAAVKRAASAARLSPMEASDAEDALGDWLEDHDITGGWDLAGTLVAGGVDVEWLDQIAAARTLVSLPPAGQIRSEWEKATIDQRRAIIAAVAEKVLLHPTGSGQKWVWRTKHGWGFDPATIEITWKV